MSDPRAGHIKIVTIAVGHVDYQFAALCILKDGATMPSSGLLIKQSERSAGNIL